MGEKLKLKKQVEGEKLIVLLDGVIDEDVDFKDIMSTDYKEYVFDFDKITMINSCGIREWICLLEKLGDVNTIYQKCPQIIIEQMNITHGFVGDKCKVESFYAPYYCEKTDVEKKVLLKSSDIKNGKAPTVQSDQGDEMEFDAIEEQYFNFLK
ncbi:MAG: hypothetical protein OXB84_06795 [Halobacteriovoraceae bacterium]|nr:hypothetical protein [Halobacteriovoraceae bacterium]